MGASRLFADFCCYGRHRMIRANRDAIKEESVARLRGFIWRADRSSGSCKSLEYTAVRLQKIIGHGRNFCAVTAPE